MYKAQRRVKGEPATAAPEHRHNPLEQGARHLLVHLVKAEHRRWMQGKDQVAQTEWWPGRQHERKQQGGTLCPQGRNTGACLRGKHQAQDDIITLSGTGDGTAALRVYSAIPRCRLTRCFRQGCKLCATQKPGEEEGRAQERK